MAQIPLGKCSAKQNKVFVCLFSTKEIVAKSQQTSDANLFILIRNVPQTCILAQKKNHTGITRS